MKQLRNVSKVLVVLVLIISASSLFIGCPIANDNQLNKEKPEYTKEDITFTFKNDSGSACSVHIKNCSSHGIDQVIIPDTEAIGLPVDGTEKTITIKDVVVSGKTSKETKDYRVSFMVSVTSGDNSRLNGGGYFIIEEEEPKSKYSNGIFHIEAYDAHDANKPNGIEKTFKVEFKE